MFSKFKTTNKLTLSPVMDLFFWGHNRGAEASLCAPCFLKAIKPYFLPLIPLPSKLRSINTGWREFEASNRSVNKRSGPLTIRDLLLNARKQSNLNKQQKKFRNSNNKRSFSPQITPKNLQLLLMAFRVLQETKHLDCMRRKEIFK